MLGLAVTPPWLVTQTLNGTKQGSSMDGPHQLRVLIGRLPTRITRTGGSRGGAVVHGLGQWSVCVTYFMGRGVGR